MLEESANKKLAIIKRKKINHTKAEARLIYTDTTLIKKDSWDLQENFVVQITNSKYEDKDEFYHTKENAFVET